MICSDILGLFQAFTPKFVKRYGDVAGEYRTVFAAYIDEVRRGVFPGDEHVYKMIEGGFCQTGRPARQVGWMTS